MSGPAWLALILVALAAGVGGLVWLTRKAPDVDQVDDSKRPVLIAAARRQVAATSGLWGPQYTRDADMSVTDLWVARRSCEDLLAQLATVPPTRELREVQNLLMDEEGRLDGLLAARYVDASPPVPRAASRPARSLPVDGAA